ncbi:MAG: hypothetical protein MJ072_03840, partial [Clostridia bacterium]|nr:hypothetical protein [Clostridia bacterium]
MKFFRKIGAIAIIQIVCFLLANAITLPVLIGRNMMSTGEYLQWVIFWHIFFSLIANVVLSHRFLQRKAQELLVFISSTLVISMIVGYVLF